jgi:hypothetical protein
MVILGKAQSVRNIIKHKNISRQQQLNKERATEADEKQG